MECGWSQSQQCCEERPLQRGQTSTDMSRGNSSCKEDECKKDFSTFDGRTTGCAEAVTKKTARKNTGCTVVHIGERSETRSWNILESGSNSAKRRMMIVSGTRELRRTH